MFIFFLSFHKEIIGINEIMNRYWETLDRIFFLFFFEKREHRLNQNDLKYESSNNYLETI